ncbi:cytokine-inducible SH2-containing protein [Anopheles nili]|uniref:cytokine-inducible SH2-containing protein n=1 Tax=Anopheles nili TaxID=185578 RepID=UPI00237AC68F|nr:cytokine-inducible SH2-containing protein [Anopheles nili]
MTMEQIDGVNGATRTCEQSTRDRPGSNRISKAATAPRPSSTDSICRFNWFLSLRRKRSSPTTVVVATAHSNKNDEAGAVKDELFTSNENNHNNQDEGGNVFYTLRKRFQKKFTSVKVKAFEPNVAGTLGAHTSASTASTNSNNIDTNQLNGPTRDANSSVDGNDFARIVIERHTQNPLRFSSPNANLPVIMNSRDTEPNTAEDGSAVLASVLSVQTAQESAQNMDQMMAQMRIDLLQYGWYWGKLTRLAAQKRLAQQVNGTFLVRDSQTEQHQFTVSFRSSGITLHCRIDFENNYWSFSGLTTPTTYKTMVDLIQDTMKKSEYGVIGYVKQDSMLMPPFPVRLTKPINRFYEVSSLQHLCRFIIRQKIDAISIAHLPLPEKLKEYVEENYYDL